MKKSLIRLLTPAVCMVAMAMLPAVAPAKSSAKAGTTTEHPRKHKIVHRHDGFRNAGFYHPRSAAGFVAIPSRSPGEVCPGNARSFDCKIWPPPFDQDPDRKMSGTDGG